MFWIGELGLGFHPRMVWDLFTSLEMGGEGVTQRIYQLENGFKLPLRSLGQFWSKLLRPCLALEAFEQWGEFNLWEGSEALTGAQNAP